MNIMSMKILCAGCPRTEDAIIRYRGKLPPAPIINRTSYPLGRAVTIELPKGWRFWISIAGESGSTLVTDESAFLCPACQAATK